MCVSVSVFASVSLCVCVCCVLCSLCCLCVAVAVVVAVVCAVTIAKMGSSGVAVTGANRLSHGENVSELNRRKSAEALHNNKSMQTSTTHNINNIAQQGCAMLDVSVSKMLRRLFLLLHLLSLRWCLLVCVLVLVLVVLFCCVT